MNTLLQSMRPRLQAVLLGIFLSLSHHADGDEGKRSLRVDRDSPVESLSEAFRTATDRASSALVTVYTLRGARMTAPWRRRAAAKNLLSATLLARDSHDEQGSGIVIDRQGLILTCNHVVASADALFVVLADGRRCEVVDVQGDPATDLAVIRIEGGGAMDEVRLGDSDDVQVGDWVVSLGNPYELRRSVSAGIVSNPNRWVPGIPHALIQNDAATNPGSSGGALLNLKGEVVGILTGGVGAGDRVQGIAMSIPVNTAKRVIQEFGKRKRVRRGYLGCQIEMLSPVVARQLGLPVSGGFYVINVEKESAAAQAGIEEGDIITHFAGLAIDETFRTRKIFEESVAGDEYTFTLFRDGRTVMVDVEMGHPPGRTDNDNGQAETQSKPPSEHFDDLLGLGLNKLTTDVAQELEFPKETKGVLVTHVARGSVAYKEGIAAGTVVLRLNSHTIRDLDDYKKAMTTYSPTKPVLLLVQTNKGKNLVVFEM